MAEQVLPVETIADFLDAAPHVVAVFVDPSLQV